MFWGKIFLFYRLTDRKIFLLSPIEQLINLEWPNNSLLGTVGTICLGTYSLSKNLLMH